MNRTPSDRAETSLVSLTGPDSHRLVREPGVGRVTLGGPGADLVVAPDARVDWTVFDPFTVPAGYPWPRVFNYEGDDVGFFAWSQRRPIENFAWTPTRAADVDARAARIARLRLTVRHAPVRIVLPRSSVDVSVTGDLSLATLDLADADACPSLALHPDTRPSRDAEPLRLPTFPALARCRSVDLYVSPLRQPFDCAGLLQFPALRHVSLSGAVTNLAALADLPGLRSVRLLYSPDLSGLPPLATWPELRTVLASNIEETAGKRLRAEIRALAKAGRTWTTVSVTELRRPDWFDREYGLPFSQWPTRPAKAAVTAYRAAAAAIGAATTVPEVERAIVGFVEVFNRMPDIDTIEREDIGEAVYQLAQLIQPAHASPGISADAALAWFDATRDF